MGQVSIDYTTTQDAGFPRAQASRPQVHTKKLLLKFMGKKAYRIIESRNYFGQKGPLKVI